MLSAAVVIGALRVKSLVNQEMEGACLDCIYCICPKMSNTKVSDKMAYANSADSDQSLMLSL